ncbi:hypothetical protein FKW77_001967 [Venturia effusa]|uniref:Protein-tyrosine phosphatase 2 n=1 Tax=Venturia effusa TaxID=50376 RepID=A0A517LQQ8_9PEZI|nr:hypothetical protein FKW77_001967 [Venturia effusa]
MDTESSGASSSDTSTLVAGGAPSKASDTGRVSPKDLLPAFLKLSRADIHSKFIDLEWQQRNRLAQGGIYTPENASQWARLANDETARRNRYMNVDPFVQNRVPLRVPEGHSDYINASFIQLTSTISGTKKEFIATQGPKEGSHSHLWRMIWHECADPVVIVMLTQTHESGREKCFQYFPFDLEDPELRINEEDEFGDGFIATLTLKNITDDKATSSTIREMELTTADGQTKKIWHMLFGGWPDYSIPEGEDINGLVRLVDFSASKNPIITGTNSSAPRVVHCSAGVGRTGTFIALDWLLAEFREGRFDNIEQDKDPIADVVDELRGQRMMMVQGEQQFFFLYDVMRQLWLDRKTDNEERLKLDSASLSSEERLRAAFEQEMKDNAERM